MCLSILNVELILTIFISSTLILFEANDVENPLLLTPLLRNGNVDEARRLSKVPQILPNIHSNAGFFTVNETRGTNQFFWFFRKIGDDWKQSPLLLWFYGGPGATSMHSVFLETGPFRLHRDKIKPRKYSWINNYNLLYIDHPVGTGFSFSNNYDLSYTTTKEQGAINALNALKQFFHLYPELRTVKFYITCESYGCKFANALAHLIHELKTKRENFINLCGIYMGSAFIDPFAYLRHSDLMHKSGSVDSRTAEKIQDLEQTAKMYIRNGFWEEACTTWKSILRAFQHSTFGLNHNNYVYENFGKDLSFVRYVTSDRMRKALHVGDLMFNVSSSSIFDHLMGDHFKSEKRNFEKLLEIYPVLFISGNLDILASPVVTQKFIRSLQWSKAEAYQCAQRQKYYFRDEVVAYYVKVGNLFHVMIRNAGHMLSVSQPRYVLELLDKFVTNNFP